MGVREIVEQIFIDTLGLALPVDWDSVRYQQLLWWDSMGHVAIVTELENRFEIVLEADDIVEMMSFARCLEILEKYGIT